MLPTYFKDGYLFFKRKTGPDSILEDSLIINSPNINGIVKYINENRILSITINPIYYKAENLDFLKEVRFIQGLYLLQKDLNVKIVNELTELRVLRTDEVSTELDFDNFRNLAVLGISYNKKYTINIDRCANLSWLWLDDFKEANFKIFSGLVNLEYLSLHKTSIMNFVGIENLRKLKEIHIDNASKLESLEGISENNISLEFLDICNAKNLNNYSDLSRINSIKKIFLSKTGEAASISFLSQLPKLQEVALGMKVVDGDVEFMKKFFRASFQDFAHYNLKSKDLKKSN